MRFTIKAQKTTTRMIKSSELFIDEVIRSRQGLLGKARAGSSLGDCRCRAYCKEGDWE